jgi:hypothetical protein
MMPSLAGHPSPLPHPPPGENDDAISRRGTTPVTCSRLGNQQFFLSGDDRLPGFERGNPEVIP